MSHTIYENFVLENKIEDMLTTHLDMNQFLTPDYDLAESAGMVKKVNKYIASGNVEELSMGEGNTGDIEVSFTQETYEVGTTQGRTYWFDEQEMTDPMVVDVALKGMSDIMTNDLTAKAIAEMDKAVITSAVSNWSFDDFADAIALYPYEEEDGLFCLINPKEKAAIRKALNDDLKYVEGFARSGYIGSVCNVPIYVSKAVPAGIAYLGTRAAIKCFVKKGVEVEQDRNPDIRKNQVWARKVMLVAMVDATRMIKMGKAQATDATITTAAKAGTSVEGAAATGANVQAYVNGEASGDAVVASSNAYSITLDAALAAGDEVKVVAKKDGFLDSIAETTVAE